LLHNAGGCRPLQGTMLTIDAREGKLPENPAANPAFSVLEYYGPSGYGAVPTFPAPAPQGGYRPTLPELVQIDGTWKLYVLDTGGSGRGTIAGGWALIFDHNVTLREAEIEVPGGAPRGAARRYPVPFDLSNVDPTLKVDPKRLALSLTLRHDQPRDLQIMLESPTHERVILMANAGGTKPVSRGIVFVDFDDVPLMPEREIVDTRYRPGSAYGPVFLPAPAPDQPIARSFDAFAGKPLAGVWNLWVFDSNEATFNGRLENPTLSYAAHTFDPRVQLSGNTPVAGTVNQPFVRVEAHSEEAVANGRARGVALWRVINKGTFYASGRCDLNPVTGDVTADVPVKQGENVISIAVLNGASGEIAFTELRRTVNEFTYALAEGATGGFFDMDITMTNAGGAAAPVAIDFLPEGGTPVATTNSVAPNSPLQIHADEVTNAGATSTVVRSLDAVPLAIERTMSWDTRGYGAHGGSATSPAKRWLFAEGSEGFFHTYVLLANDQATDVGVTVKFLLEGGGVITHNVTVPARSRRTVDASTVPGVRNNSFGLDITAAAPIIAERAMYFSVGTDRTFEGGHESAGVNETSTRWFLAEGATGPFFDCFVLLSNPNPSEAHVSLTYLLPDGATIAQTVTMKPNSRETINVETVAPLLANAAVSTIITADIGIVAERAMYWPNAALGWREAHNSFGVTDPGLRWGLADGRIGGPRGHETYILLANPNALPSEVQVRFLQAGVTATRIYTLPPTSRLSIQAGADIGELHAGVFGAEIQVLNEQPIAVEKALYWNSGSEIWAAGTNVTATRLPPP
jgi:subtilisin-like proprotein convertase family protein